MGIMAALFERSKSGLGQIIDANMVEGAAYVGSWIYLSQVRTISYCIVLSYNSVLKSDKSAILGSILFVSKAKNQREFFGDVKDLKIAKIEFLRF